MTYKGSVVSIHIAAQPGAPMSSQAQAHAVPGRGLEGDRYFEKIGTFSGHPGGGRQVTLIEVEAIESLRRDYQIVLDPGDGRRNIVTRGVPLNHLVGRDFRVGEVSLRGVRLCEPCSHLARLNNQTSLRGLVHRGGLRADILTEGTIHVGDPVWD